MFAFLRTAYVHYIILITSVTFAQVASGKTFIHKPTATGKDFYIVFPKAAYGDASVKAIINSPVKQRIHIVGAGSAGPGTDTLIQVPGSQFIYENIFHIESTSEITDIKGAARITTASPVSVIGQYGAGGISGTYNAMPVSSWGTEYYVLDEPEGINSGYAYYPGIYSVPQVTIIASQPNTTITITLTTRTAMGRDSTFSITLNNAGDVYSFTDGADPNAVNRIENPGKADFSGTHIISTDPGKLIGIIVSQSFTSDPRIDNDCGNFGMQWLPPVANWDTGYIITQTPAHDTTRYYGGELLRMIFSQNNTELYRKNSTGDTMLGTFNAGDVYVDTVPIKNGFLLHASNPFLPMEITSAPYICGNGGSGLNYTFSMMIPVGIDQWSDFNPFSTADQAVTSDAVIYFRESDLNNLYINGPPAINDVPLAAATAIVHKIGGGYAYVDIPLGADIYYELYGINGATAGGAVWGYGQYSYSANDGNGGTHVLTPQMTKSFAHPIGMNGLPLSNPDSIPPEVTASYNCGLWFPVITHDTAYRYLGNYVSGIYDIALAENQPPDSSYNVAFSPAPSFITGADSVEFGIQVLNLADTAVAALHIIDGAGNELDTTLIHVPSTISVGPAVLNVSGIQNGHKDTEMIYISNPGINSVTFLSLRLAIGIHWQLLPLSPKIPFTIEPDSSVNVYVQYTAPLTDSVECDPDTLFVHTCRQFPITKMVGCSTGSSAVQELSIPPTGFVLAQNYPNPAASATTIMFNTASEGNVTLKIYNALGNEVTTLVSDRLAAGAHSAQWDTN
ncbi:MAG TPA: hypothetical protein VFA55_10190, partial [Candidatus Kapabacteria bacterium]|nr:hypothetical protein [Candidatus Kapabacteria bacterium]